MRLQDALAKQFGMMYATAAANLEGFTQEKSMVQPEPDGNCANWILGHLVTVHNGAMGLLGEAPVWDGEQLSRERFFHPVNNPSESIDWNMLRDRFLSSKDRCVEAISRLSDAAMAEPVPDPFGGGTTRGDLLARLAYHQAYHVGQLGVVRRIAGLEGKVKGPGQPNEMNRATTKRWETVSADGRKLASVEISTLWDRNGPHSETENPCRVLRHGFLVLVR